MVYKNIKSGGEPDYVVFSHDDVYISDYGLFLRRLYSLKKDILFRRITSPVHFEKDIYYAMIDCVIMKPSAVVKIVEGLTKLRLNIDQIPKDKRGSPCSEIFWGGVFSKYLDIQCEEVDLTIKGDTNVFGFFHIKKERCSIC